MKKISITLVLLLISSFTGCFDDNNPEIEENDYTYNQDITIQTYNSIEIFDSIFLVDESKLDSVTKKNTIFNKELTKEIVFNEFSILTSTSSRMEDINPEMLNYSLLRKFRYKGIKYYVSNYIHEDFSIYFNQDFIDDIIKLENDEITAGEIFNKYGTHAVFAMTNGFFYDLSITMDSKSLSQDEFHFIIEYVAEFTKDKYNEEDIDKFNELSKKSNMKLIINSNYLGDNYFDIINNVTTQNYNYSYFISKDDYLPIWEVINDEHTKAIDLLKNYYNEFISTTNI